MTTSANMNKCRGGDPAKVSGTIAINGKKCDGCVVTICISYVNRAVSQLTQATCPTFSGEPTRASSARTAASAVAAAAKSASSASTTCSSAGSASAKMEKSSDSPRHAETLICIPYIHNYIIYMYMEQWELVEHGPSFGGAEMLNVKDMLNTEVTGIDYDDSLAKRASKISRMLRYTLGIGHWQVIFIKGRHARRFSCSRNYFCVFQKKDGLRAYLWVNRFMTEEQLEHRAMP